MPYHIPVLFQESIDALDINPKGTYVDLTFGGGGHSRGILAQLGPKGRLVAFDQDKDAMANIPDDKRLLFVESNFRFMRGWLRYYGIDQVDCILADLGVSSHHFDTQERGFSFRFDAPLDMRMNQRATISAADIINEYDLQRLTDILKQYGELDNAFRTVQAIESSRNRAPITTINELLEAVKPVTPKQAESKFYAKLFQAIRIEVNHEMEALKMMLEQSLKVLKPGGRMVVITYHSLEDRLVKNFFKSGNFEGRIEKDFFGVPSTPFEAITRKALLPSDEEIERNPRSRSAKMRVVEKKQTSNDRTK